MASKECCHDKIVALEAERDALKSRVLVLENALRNVDQYADAYQQNMKDCTAVLAREDCGAE
ncbi:MAG: hypothetical protein ACYTEX_11010 [Planctomycetota bacterium]|jgi:hypothetical protein